MSGRQEIQTQPTHRDDDHGDDDDDDTSMLIADPQSRFTSASGSSDVTCHDSQHDLPQRSLYQVREIHELIIVFDLGYTGFSCRQTLLCFVVLLPILAFRLRVSSY